MREVVRHDRLLPLSARGPRRADVARLEAAQRTAADTPPYRLSSSGFSHAAPCAAQPAVAFVSSNGRPPDDDREAFSALRRVLSEAGVGQRVSRSQWEEAIATLKTQLADAKVTLKENEKKATEYAREYGKEFYLRKQIAEQLQELTGGLRVFCRVRPPPPGDDSGDAVTTLDETTVLLQDKADKKRPTRRFSPAYAMRSCASVRRTQRRQTAPVVRALLRPPAR